MTPEVWLPIPGYERTYEASNLGRVRRVSDACGTRAGLILSPNLSNGYLVVTLSQDGVAKNWRLSRAVLSAFCGPEPFEGAQACHNDGDTLNNELRNLRWGTPVENQADRVRHKTDLRGSRVYGAKLTEEQVAAIKVRCRAGELNPSIARDYGVSISTIHLIRHDETWRHVA